MFRVDLHIHSKYSRDGISTPRQIIAYALKRGLGGVAVTDHDTLKGGIETMKIAPKDFIVVPGVELSLPYGHILALNVKEMPKKTMIEELVDEIHGLGGIAVLAHPFGEVHGCKALDEVARCVDAIEVANAKTLFYERHIEKASALSEQYGKGVTAGSDSHIPETIGDTQLITPSNPEGRDELITLLLKGGCSIAGYRTSLSNRLLELYRRAMKRVKGSVKP